MKKTAMRLRRKGSFVLAFLLALSAAIIPRPASAASTNVSDDTELQAALANPLYDEIVVIADISTPWVTPVNITIPAGKTLIFNAQNLVTPTNGSWTIVNNGTLILREYMMIEAPNSSIINNGMFNLEGDGGFYLAAPTNSFENNGTIVKANPNAFFRVNIHALAENNGEMVLANTGLGVEFPSNMTGTNNTRYIVLFDENYSGAGSPLEMRVFAADMSAYMPNPSRGTDYLFVEWNTAADGSGSAFTSTTALTTAPGTVYGIWKPMLTVQAGLNGTVGSSGGYQQIGATVPISATANAGYRFAGWTGSVTFADASAASTSLTMPATAETITANFAPNTPPVAKGSIPTQNVAVGQSVTFSAADIANDSDGDSLSITAIVTPPSGSTATASLSGGSITLTGAAVGTSNIVVTVGDGDDTVNITVPINVLAVPVNTPPVAKGIIPTQNVTVGQSVTFNAADIADDSDGDPLSITTIVTPPSGSVATASLSGGSITLTGAAVGTSNIVVMVSDGYDTVNITVPINVLAAPVIPTPTPTPAPTPTPTPTPPSGSGSSGANLSYGFSQMPSESNDYTAICDGAYSKLTGVYVDNRLLGGSQYSAWEGSTYVKLNASYVSTLSAGVHTLTLQFTDGSASGSFTVARNSGITGIYVLPYGENPASYTPSVTPSLNAITNEKVAEGAEEREITDDNDDYQSEDANDDSADDAGMPSPIAPATGDRSFNTIFLFAIVLVVALAGLIFVRKRFVD